MRKALLAKRRAIAPQDKLAWDARIGARLQEWCAQNAVRELAVYWALAGEPDLSATYVELAAAGVRLLLPVVVERGAALAFAEWMPGEAMHVDAMRVAVPENLRLAPRPGAVLVPCVGFNAQGFRIGYGGGYYDRTLAAAPRPASVGVAYSCLQAEFASDAHDVPLDVVLTET